MTSQLGDSQDQETSVFGNSSDFAGTDGDESGVPETSVPVQHTGRRGFLPFPTNAFDRVFISVVCFVAIHLLWMRFLEEYLSLYVAGAALAFI